MFSYVGSEQQTAGLGGRRLCTDTSCFSAPKPYRCYHHFLSPGDACEIREMHSKYSFIQISVCYIRAVELNEPVSSTRRGGGGPQLVEIWRI